MFTEETGGFELQDIIMKLISRYCNSLNLVFLSFFLVIFLLSLPVFIVNMVNQLISWL